MPCFDMPDSPHVLFSGCHLAQSRTLNYIERLVCLKAMHPFMDLAQKASLWAG